MQYQVGRHGKTCATICHPQGSARKVFGLLLVAVAAFMFSIVTLCVKTSISDGMLFGGVLLFKSVFSWVINVTVAFCRGLSFRQQFGPLRKIPLLVILGTFGSFAQLAAFYAVSVLSMGDANVYLMTSPVFVFILARFWLGDPIDWLDVVAALVCIVGVFFVSYPSAIFGCDSTDDCGLTQYCNLNGTCAECGDDVDAAPELRSILTTENYTAHQICSGVEKLTNTSISNPQAPSQEWTVTGPLYCDTSSGVEISVIHPVVEHNCQYHCLHDLADCGYFTSGQASGSLTCILYLSDVCNATNYASSEAILEYPFDNFVDDPPILFHMLGESREADSSAEGVAIMMAIMSAASAAVTYCVIRKLGRSVNSFVAVNYHVFLAAVVGGAVCLVQGLPLPLNSEVWGAVVGLGLAGFVGQWLMTIGFQLEKPGPASVIRYCDVIFVFIWDAVFFDTTPGWNSYTGAVFVILAAVTIVVNKSRKEKLGVQQQRPILKLGDCACCCGPADEFDGDTGGGRRGHRVTKVEEKRQEELRSKLRAVVYAEAGIRMMSLGLGKGLKTEPQLHGEGASVSNDDTLQSPSDSVAKKYLVV